MPLNVLTEEVSIAELCNEVAKLQKMVNYLTGGQLDFDNIRVKGIVADNIDVNELSAITANMGKLTSGEIYGSYIATAEGAYPRAEMSSTDDLIAAYQTANQYVIVSPLYSGAGAPAIVFLDGNVPMSGLIYLDDSLQELNIGTTKNIRLSVGISGYTKIDGQVRIGNFSDLFSAGASQTLQTALNNKANGSGLSRTVYVALTSGGPATSPMTISNGIVTS